MTTAIITWRKPAAEMPDADLEVLLTVRRPDGERYVTIGALGADGWVNADGWPLEIDRVVAWAHAPEPAGDEA